ncbi:MAG TPA: hypothetical protein VHA56_09255 [Mucilaginibacter sp.]|nr:hypothetical protein [Mucilaginibacter sp.]
MDYYLQDPYYKLKEAYDYLRSKSNFFYLSNDCDEDNKNKQFKILNEQAPQIFGDLIAELNLFKEFKVRKKWFSFQKNNPVRFTMPVTVEPQFDALRNAIAKAKDNPQVKSLIEAFVECKKQFEEIPCHSL